MYLFNALKRDKDNNGMKSDGIVSIRHVMYAGMTEDDVISKLIGSIISTRNVGIWRIYATVSKRNFKKAKMQLITKLVETLTDEIYENNIESDYKTILAKPEMASDRRYLIDIDCKDKEYAMLVQDKIYRSYENDPILGGMVTCSKLIETPNGYHIVVDKIFDTRVLAGMENVEIKKDALVFIMIFELTSDLKIKVLPPTAKRLYKHGIS